MLRADERCTLLEIENVTTTVEREQELTRTRRRVGQVLEHIRGACVVTPLVEGDGQPPGFVAVTRDVTANHLRTQKAVDVSQTSPLTGLYERHSLELRLAMLHDRPANHPPVLTWIMSDIDRFKHVNDTLGHDSGDAVLKAVAALLRCAVRRSDWMFRVGGTEFVLMLVGATAAAAAAVAERLRGEVEALSVTVGTDSVRVTASWGVVQQAIGETWAAALERADAALHLAKQAGRNRVVLAESLATAGCCPSHP